MGPYLNTIREAIYKIGLDVYEGNIKTMVCMFDNVIRAFASPLAE